MCDGCDRLLWKVWFKTRLRVPSALCPSLRSFHKYSVLFVHSVKSAYWTWSLASGCCSAAKQLCSSGQQATALYVFYLQWNLYEPTVTSTWMGPSVQIGFWRHLIGAGGTHSLKVGHTAALHQFQREAGPPHSPECGDGTTGRSVWPVRLIPVVPHQGPLHWHGPPVCVAVVLKDEPPPLDPTLITTPYFPTRP